MVSKCLPIGSSPKKYCRANESLTMIWLAPSSRWSWSKVCPWRKGIPRACEIAGVRPADDGILGLSLRQRGVLRNPETAVAAIALAGNLSDQSGGLDPGQSAHALEQGFKEIHARGGLVVLRLREGGDRW